jgi:hypothetical protein
MKRLVIDASKISDLNIVREPVCSPDGERIVATRTTITFQSEEPQTYIAYETEESVEEEK